MTGDHHYHNISALPINTDRRLRSLIENSLDVVSILDQNGCVLYESPSIQRVLGWTPEEMYGKYALELIHPDDRSAVQNLLAQNIAVNGNIIQVEYRYRHRDGTWRHMESIATNLLNDPDIQGIVINSRDITERKEQVEALRTSNERFANAFEYAAIGMALVSVHGTWLKVNRALASFIGYTLEELTKLTFLDVTHRDDIEPDLMNVRRLLNNEIPFYHMEKRYIHKNGNILWGHLAVSLVRDANGKPVHFISQIQDINERKMAEERLVHDALHDNLTGLANRALLRDHIQSAHNRYLRNPAEPFALILADLDRFKNINDTRGHQAGDTVLLEVAKRLTAVVRATDTVARLGGDEFAILLEDISGENNPTRIARRLLADMAEPIPLQDTLVEIGISMGVVVVTEDHNSTEEVFRDADIALYRAKTAGRGNFQVFDQAMHVRIRERMELEADLRHAAERNQLKLFLQPVIDVRAGNIVAFEALLRWMHPVKGFVQPSVFIPMAEETGLIEAIGKWVATEACEIIRDWPDDNPPPISINASSAEIIRPSNQSAMSDYAINPEPFDERMVRLVKEQGIPADLLRIEITESVLIEDLKYATYVMSNLVRSGFKLLLDDFGTGYSSFSYLQDLPLYQVKLDPQFTGRLHPRNRSFSLLQGITTLAHNIDLQVVAEGIETAQQLELIRDANVDRAQGYHIARPLPVVEAHKIYRSRKRW